MIRPATIEDIDLFYELNCDMEQEQFDYETFKNIYESLLLNPNHIFFVAEVKGKKAGGLHMRIEKQLHHCAFVAEMIELTVLPEFRSKGIGKALVEHAVTYARQADCAVIELRSNAKRLRAHRFYERLGFIKTHVSLMMLLSEN